MSASNGKSSATPPVRSIAGERRGSTLSHSVELKSSVERQTKSEKNRDRSASSSSSSSYSYRSSSSDSLRSYTIQRLTLDGESPDNETYESWRTIQEQLHSLRGMGKFRTSRSHLQQSLSAKENVGHVSCFSRFI